MARAVFNARVFIAALSDGYIAGSRGFAKAAAGGSGRLMATEEKAVLMKGKKDAAIAASDPAAAVAWIPDPVTGYYRPANRLREMDPVDLRQLLLKR